VIAASACSGHGFKHSPAVGERLARLVTEPGHLPDAVFGLARFAG
jgi:glycine/D-amino acid oxidase-like deaminating enzyme